MVMASSSYARIAGLQSEVGRVVITRVAGSEVDYKRQINMYHKDMTVSVNSIRREQIKMRRRNRKYVKKLKQARIENLKRTEEEKRRDEERALLEALHLRLKAEAAAARVRRYSAKEVKEPETGSSSVDSGIQEDEPVSPTQIQLKDDPVYIDTSPKDKHENTDMKSNETPSDSGKSNRLGGVKEGRPYANVLPMINEELEKEKEEEQSESVLEPDVDGQENDLLNLAEVRVMDDELSVSSFGRKRPKKKEISFSDIIKLKYRSTQQLFDLVHVLAKRHGIPDIEEKVPDPRDNVVHRGANDGSFGLQASVLYPMKYGYATDSRTNNNAEEPFQLLPPISVVPPSIVSEEEQTESSRAGGRKLSLDERRQLFLSGKYSKSDENGSESSSQQSNTEDTEPKLKSKDKSLPLLVDKVNKVKLNQRAMSESDNSYFLLSPPKPSSSRSSRSLPPLSQSKGKGSSVSWTEAFGLIRAIRSLDNVS